MAESAHEQVENDEEETEPGFTTHDLKEIDKFSSLTIEKKSEMHNWDKKVRQMSSMGHWYDCHVPIKEKWLFNCVSLKTWTDKTAIQNRLKEYKKLYQEMETSVIKMREAGRVGKVNADDILKLYDKLSRMIQEAEQDKEATNSSTLYEIHVEFLRNQETLENMIKRVECVALRQQLKQVTCAWKQALKEMSDLKEEMGVIKEQNKNLESKVDSLVIAVQEMAEQQKTVLQQNRLMSELLKQTLEKK